MLSPHQLKLKHLYSRATFGTSLKELQERKNWSISKAVNELLENSSSYSPLHSSSDFSQFKSPRMLSDEEKRMQIKMAREAVRQLNTDWLLRLGNSKQQLREKMTLLWHGHFACRSQNPMFLVELNNIHRKHALGSFRTMLIEVAKAPAMLQFLNNQQNRKGHPNENFARELMELFTLGRGNYTEQDIKESARAFTGWGFNRSGAFQFRPIVHDDDEKSFLGKRGNFDGTDIIDIILEKPASARFVASKIYRHLVNDIADLSRINELGDYFYKENYDIGKLVRKILTSEWFYDEKNLGAKIKSPVELLAGINKLFFVEYQSPKILLQFQNALGQTLFYPPNVAGWAGGRNWIDSSSLMLRLKIPSLILNGGDLSFAAKGDPEDEAEIAMARIVQKKAIQRRVLTNTNWEKFLEQLPPGIEPKDLAGFLLQLKINNRILNKIKGSSLKSATLVLISTPEFQLS